MKAMMLCLVALLFTGCGGLGHVPSGTYAVKLIPPPQVTFTPLAPEESIENSRTPVRMQSVISLLDPRYSQVTVTFNSTRVIRRSAGFVISTGDQTMRVFVAVSIPRDFQEGQYSIRQTLDLRLYSVENEAEPAAIFKRYPEQLSAFGEIETEGEACDQRVQGNLEVTSRSPLQGSFQFFCEFANGQAMSVSGSFSQ